MTFTAGEPQAGLETPSLDGFTPMAIQRLSMGTSQLFASGELLVPAIICTQGWCRCGPVLNITCLVAAPFEAGLTAGFSIQDCDGCADTSCIRIKLLAAAAAPHTGCLSPAAAGGHKPPPAPHCRSRALHPVALCSGWCVIQDQAWLATR